MLKQEMRYSIVCDDCGGLITTDRFKTKEEAENYGWGCGVIRSLDKESPILCNACRVTRNKGKKCIVKDCANHANEGTFIGDLCSPCNEFITASTANRSQACRNAIQKIADLAQAFLDDVARGKITTLESNQIRDGLESG